MFTDINHRQYPDQDAAAFSAEPPAVYSHCRHYSPRGSAGIMNMENYSMCESCAHRRSDERCGIAEKTLM